MSWPGTRLTSWQLPGPPGVSLRQLLGHTAGLGVPFYPGYARDAAQPTLRQSLDGEAPAATKAVRAEAAARGRFRYSGGGYAVVQQLVADVSGQPFSEAAQALVLRPLGMTSSTFAQPLPDLRPLAARPDWHVYPESAAAGLGTTSADLARFAAAVAAAVAAAAIQRPGAGGSLAVAAAGRGSMAGAGPAALLVSDHAAVPVRGEWLILPLLGIRWPRSCGLGMFGFGGGRFGHVGGAASFFSVLVASVRDGNGAVVMTAANASPFPFRLLRAVSAEQGWTGFVPAGWRQLHDLRARIGSRA